MGRRFSPGFKGKFRADEVNSWQRTAEIVLGTRLQSRQVDLPPSDRDGTIIIKNNSGADRAQFTILGINGFVIDPDDADALIQFKQRVALTCVVPIGRGHEVDPEIHTEDSFVVLAEPIKNGKLGRAWASGICPVQVYINDEAHRYARIIDDDTTKLETADSGPVVILWKVDGIATDTVWAVIRWGGSPSGSNRYRVKNIFKDYIECKTWDGTTEGSVFVNVAKPYLLRGTLASHDGKTFSAATVDGQQKLATQGSTVETWEMTELYVVDDEIYAEQSPNGGTGVSVSGAALTLLDTNKDGRNWAMLNTTPPALAEGGTADDSEFPFWAQGYAFLECPGSELIVVIAAIETGTFIGDGAEITVTARSSAIGSVALSGAASVLTAAGRASAKGGGAVSGAASELVETVRSSAIGSVALSGAGAIMKGYGG